PTCFSVASTCFSVGSFRSACLLLHGLAGTALLGDIAPAGIRLTSKGLTCTSLALITKPLGYIAVAIRYRTAMRRIVGPGVVRNVGPVELVVSEGIDINVATPPVYASPDRRTRENTSPPRERAAGIVTGRIPIKWLIVGIGPCAIHHVRIIDRQVVFVWVRALDRVHVCWGTG